MTTTRKTVQLSPVEDFVDETPTPEHDKIMIWLDTHGPEYVRRDLDPYVQRCVKGCKDVIKRLKVKVESDPQGVLDVGSTQWEYPVVKQSQYKGQATGSPYIVGYIDAVVECQYSYHSVVEHWLDDIKTELEQKLDGLYGPHGLMSRLSMDDFYQKAIADAEQRVEYLSGLLEAGFEKIGRPHLLEHSIIYCFEVKPTIVSLGALVRQINKYKTYTKGVYVVVSPDATYEEQLANQNIRFLLYKE